MADFKPHTVYIAADHAGLTAKRKIVNELEGEFRIVDLGPDRLDPSDDFTPHARQTAIKVVTDSGSLGVLVCGSGEGMAIAANKIDGIRAAVVWDEVVAEETRQDNDANILALPARFESEADLIKITRRFLSTPFSGEARHKRRIEQIARLEEG